MQRWETYACSDLRLTTTNNLTLKPRPTRCSPSCTHTHFPNDLIHMIANPIPRGNKRRRTISPSAKEPQSPGASTMSSACQTHNRTSIPLVTRPHPSPVVENHDIAPDRLFAVVVRLLERFPSQTSRGATDAGLGKSSPRVDPTTWFFLNRRWR